MNGIFSERWGDWFVDFEAEPETLEPDSDIPGVNEQIKASFLSGNDAAWFSVRCSVKHIPTGLEGEQYLGCCSYNSFKSFLSDPYAYQMLEYAMRDAALEADFQLTRHEQTRERLQQLAALAQ